MILKTSRVTLRPIVLDDAPRYVRWLSDTEVNQFTTMTSITLSEEKKWIRSLAKNKDQVVLAIDTSEGIHIGSIGFHEIRRKNKNATLGILIGDKNYWNKGYGMEAMKLILDYGFQKLDLHRIELYVFSFNKRAIHVYEKLGFRHEGQKREFVFHNGKWHDEVLMGFLKNEYHPLL